MKNRYITSYDFFSTLAMCSIHDREQSYIVKSIYPYSKSILIKMDYYNSFKNSSHVYLFFDMNSIFDIYDFLPSLALIF